MLISLVPRPLHLHHRQVIELGLQSGPAAGRAVSAGRTFPPPGTLHVSTPPHVLQHIQAVCVDLGGLGGGGANVECPGGSTPHILQNVWLRELVWGVGEDNLAWPICPAGPASRLQPARGVGGTDERTHRAGAATDTYASARAATEIRTVLPSCARFGAAADGLYRAQPKPHYRK